MKYKHANGFTLMELIITLTIASILAAIGVPSYKSFTNNQRVKTSAQDLFSTLIYARSEAIKRNNSVFVVPNDGSWQKGWAITSVENKTYASCLDDATGCIKIQESISKIDISGAPASVIYQRTGRLSAAANASFALCDADVSSNVTKRIVSIDLSGLPNINLDGACS